MIDALACMSVFVVVALLSQLCFVGGAFLLTCDALNDWHKS